MQEFIAFLRTGVAAAIVPHPPKAEANKIFLGVKKNKVVENYWTFEKKFFLIQIIYLKIIGKLNSLKFIFTVDNLMCLINLFLNDSWKIHIF
ncbi:hypothetical protein OVS_03525 [Mycoplasma ovis str. Michigan]|uniref:Uncharacterized protein n=1 Tax=Mycoplasma ovis str. Michigan TaxID=1415773 RepID=A0ABM5P222_9MOLU|nr:hypothetical protein OVS_03525 [Mycoplasma ovis str. Michigan]